MKNNVIILRDVINSPQKAFDEISSNGKKYLPSAFLIIFLAALSDPIWTYFLDSSSLFYYVDEKLNPDYISIFFEIELGFFLGILSVAATYEIGKRVGGQGDFKGVFSCICYSSLPATIIGGLISISVILLFFESGSEAFLGDGFFGFSILTVLLFTILIASAVWSFILTIIALKKSHKLSTGKSIGVTILVGLIISIISILISLQRF